MTDTANRLLLDITRALEQVSVQVNDLVRRRNVLRECATRLRLGEDPRKIRVDIEGLLE